MPNPIKPYSWIVRFDVAPVWVADGFNLTDERALEMLEQDLRYATSGEELAARVIVAPPAAFILEEQGYRLGAPDAMRELRTIMNSAPHAYRRAPDAADALETLDAAISLLDSVAFVQHENDNTSTVLARLRELHAVMSGTDPISDIEWQAAED